MFRGVTIVPGEEARALALDLADAKRHARVESAREETSVTEAVESAVAWYERCADRSLVTATWRATYDGFPGERDDCRRGAFWEKSGDRWSLFLPKSPLALDGDDLGVVTSVTYLDATGETQTLDLDDYIVSTTSEPPTITPKPGVLWPISLASPESVVVLFDAGYGDDADAVPQDIRKCLRLLVNHFYGPGRENVVTGTIVNEMPLAIRSLFWSTRAPRRAA